MGSRRKVEELIEQGRVQIDGDIVTDLSCKVEPTKLKSRSMVNY
ncbi:MAG: S4 domain-containing protein [Pirellulaceae bacterium]